MDVAPQPREDQPGYLTLPPGTQAPIDFPPMCLVQGSIRDEAVAVAAALNTPYFPQLRRIIFTDINRRLATYGNVA